MSNGYGGYSPSKGGKGRVDIGAAIEGITTEIDTAYEKEKTRREGLSDVYLKTKKEFREPPTYPHDGINNWFQDQTSFIKKELYDDFQLLKKGKISDNHYRTKHSNLLDSWNKLSMIAKNWNADSEAVIKGLQRGEDDSAPALSKLSAFMAAKKLILANYEKTKLRMGPNGYLTIAEYVTADQADDYDFQEKYPKLKEGDMIPGTSQPIDKMIDPQNVISPRYDIPKNMVNIWKKLNKQGVTVVENGVHKISTDQSKRTDAMIIIAQEWNVVKSDKRTITNFLTALNENHEYYDTDDDRSKKIDEYLGTGEMEIRIDSKVQELLAEEEFDYIDEIGTTTTIKKDDVNREEYAKKMADRAAQGDASMLMLKMESNEGTQDIWQPKFDSFIEKGDQGIIEAEKDMSITYSNWNPKTGEITTTTEHYQAGDDVPIGELQKINARAEFANLAKVYAGGTSKIDPSYESPDQRRARIERERKAKLELEKTKAAIPDVLNKNLKIVDGDKQEINDLIAANDKIIDIKIKRDSDGNKFFEIRHPSKGGKKQYSKVEFVYDKDGYEDKKASAKRIHLKTGIGGEKSWDKSIGEHEIQEKTEETQKVKVIQAVDYHSISNDDKKYNITDRDTNKKGLVTVKKMIENIIRDDDSDLGVKRTELLLQEVGRIPASAIAISTDSGAKGFRDNLNIEVKSKTGKKKTFTIVVDITESDSDFSGKRNEAKAKLQEAFEWYHGKRKRTILELGEENPDLDADALIKLYNNQ